MILLLLLLSFFFQLITSSLSINNNTVELLLIGDSIDRFITVDWCENVHEICRHNNIIKDIWSSKCSFLKPWVTTSITDNDDPYFQCINKNGDRITNVHMLGSKPNGTYFHDSENLIGIKYRNSLERLDKALELYYNLFGAPTIIIYNTILWDILAILEPYNSNNNNNNNNNNDNNEFVDPFINDSDLFFSLLKEFKLNFINRLNQIDSFILNYNKINNINMTIDVGVRTAVWIKKGGRLLKYANNIVRQIAYERNCIIYDLDYDVWSSYQFNYTINENLILRDWIHPMKYYTIAAGEKMINKRYSKFYYKSGIYLSSKVSKELNFLRHIDRNNVISSFYQFVNMTILLIQSAYNNKLYLISNKEIIYDNNNLIVDVIFKNRWLVNNPKSLFHNFHLGIGDIMLVTEKLIESIPYNGHFINLFNENLIMNNVCIITNNNIIYKVYNNPFIIKLILSIKDECDSKNDVIYNNFNDDWILFMKIVEI